MGRTRCPTVKMAGEYPWQHRLRPISHMVLMPNFSRRPVAPAGGASLGQGMIAPDLTPDLPDLPRARAGGAAALDRLLEACHNYLRVLARTQIHQALPVQKRD